MKAFLIKFLKSKVLKELLLLGAEEYVKRTDTKLDDKGLEIIKKALD